MKIKQVAVYKDYVFEQKDVREAVKDITLDEKHFIHFHYSFEILLFIFVLLEETYHLACLGL